MSDKNSGNSSAQPVDQQETAESRRGPRKDIAALLADTSVMSTENIEAFKTTLAGKSLGELSSELELSEDAQDGLSHIGHYRPCCELVDGNLADWIERTFAYTKLQEGAKKLLAEIDETIFLSERLKVRIASHGEEPEKIIQILNNDLNRCLKFSDIQMIKNIETIMMNYFQIHPLLKTKKLYDALGHTLKKGLLEYVGIYVGLAADGGWSGEGLSEAEVNRVEGILVEEWLKGLEPEGSDRLWSEQDQAVLDLLGINFSDHLPDGEGRRRMLSIIATVLDDDRPFSKEDYAGVLDRFGVGEEAITKEDMASCFEENLNVLFKEQGRSIQNALKNLSTLSDLFGFSTQDMSPEQIKAINEVVKNALKSEVCEIEFVLGVVQWAEKINLSLIVSEKMILRIAHHRKYWFEEVQVNADYDVETTDSAAAGMVARLDELGRHFGVTEKVMQAEANALKEAIEVLLDPSSHKLQSTPIEISKWIRGDSDFVKKLTGKIHELLIDRGFPLEKMGLGNQSLADSFRGLEEKFKNEANDFYAQAQEDGKASWTEAFIQSELDKKLTGLREIKRLLGVSG